MLKSGERYLGIAVVFSQPIPGLNYRQSGKYSILPKGCRTAWIRDYELALDSEGASVSLRMKNNQHRLFHKDIVACETVLLRLVQKQLARHCQIKSYKAIRECLVGQLSALVSQDKERERRVSVQFVAAE